MDNETPTSGDFTIQGRAEGFSTKQRLPKKGSPDEKIFFTTMYEIFLPLILETVLHNSRVPSPPNLRVSPSPRHRVSNSTFNCDTCVSPVYPQLGIHVSINWQWFLFVEVGLKMHPWYWQNWQGLPYLTCSLLADWSHGFFTQHFWSRSPETELTQLLHPDASGYRLKQVHGNVVLTPAEISIQLQQAQQDTENNPAWASADGLMSEQPLQAVWVASADCTPVLIADQKTGHVAAVHAGWRGTAAKIVPQAINKLLANGSELADLRIAMGPAIAGEVYQVSQQTAIEVGSSILHHEDEKAMIAALKDFSDPPVLADEKPGHVRLDVRRVNYLQMEMMGISPEQIAIAPYCTYQTPEHFFSYRRDNLKKVQWSGIVSG